MRLREKSNKTQFQFSPLEVGSFEDKTTTHYACARARTHTHTHTRGHFIKGQWFWEHSDMAGSETSSETGRLPTGTGTWTISISITWKPIRKAESQILSQIHPLNQLLWAGLSIVAFLNKPCTGDSEAHSNLTTCLGQRNGPQPAGHIFRTRWTALLKLHEAVSWQP